MRKFVFMGMAAFAALSVSLGATTAFAATPGVGQNQYNNSQISCDGTIHGAFANTNGNFGWLGQNGGASSQTGDNNADAAAYCRSLT